MSRITLADIAAVLNQPPLPAAEAPRAIAGIANAGGNVVGMMPHPEHAVDLLTGPSTDGLGIFASVLTSLAVTA